MPLTALTIIVLVGVTAIVGYITRLIFDRTRISDVLWLMLFGILLTRLDFVPVDFFQAFTPLLAGVALLVMMLDSGMHVEFYDFVKRVGRSFGLAVIGFVVSSGAVALILYGLGFDFFISLLMGTILGSASSNVVQSISPKVRMGNDYRTILNLETILSDPIAIVAALTIIGFMVPVSGVTPGQMMASMFAIGILLGLIIGIIWLWILDKIKGKPFDYMFTMGIAFCLYGIVEFVGGSGAIAVLFFALALGNSKTFSQILHLGKEYTISPFLKKFQSEIHFFVRAFFFILIGIIAKVTWDYVLYGTIIAAALIATRFVSVRIATARMNIEKYERIAMSIMVPRDLAAIVLAQIAVSKGISGSEGFMPIIFVVIFITVLYTAVASFWLSIPKISKNEIKNGIEGKLRRREVMLTPIDEGENEQRVKIKKMRAKDYK